MFVCGVTGTLRQWDFQLDIKVSYLGDLPCAWICKQRCTADGIVAMSCRYGVAA